MKKNDNKIWIAMPRYKLRKKIISDFFSKEDTHEKTGLELGYGSGDMLIELSEKGLKMFGFDFSSEAFKMATDFIKKNSHDCHNDITLFRNERDTLNRRYNYIMAFEVFEHVENDFGMIKNLRDLLLDNGKLIFSVPAHQKKWGKSDELAGHYRRYEKNDIIELLNRSGYNIISIWNYGFPLSLILDFFLHKLYRPLIYKNKKLTNLELSKISGTHRKTSLLYRIASSDILLFPFMFGQKFFLNKDFGSGYIIIAEKK